ncbi:MAG: hypothetical protein QXO15_00335 [Nitrososphaerota archaeon]
MPYRIEIFIGSDNDTKKISKDYLERVKKWASRVFPEGYAILKSKGFYNGESEDSLIICVLSYQDLDLNREIALLKKELKQESILLAKYFVELEVV